MKDRIQVRVAGKLNLSLNITGRENGFHSLDTVFSSVDVFDTVTAIRRDDGVVTVKFVGCDIDPNASTAAVAVRAVRAQNICPIGADITVEKNIPVGSGLGGSSADAAGVIVALDKLFDLSAHGFDPVSAACNAGSDTAFMLKGGMARAEGRGERLTFFSGKLPYKLVLAFPSSGVETAACYKKFDELYPDFRYAPADTDALVAALKIGDRESVRHLQNALTAPAVARNPAVGTLLDRLRSSGAITSFMTGSGSGCVGVYEKDAQIDFARLDGFTVKEICLIDAGITAVEKT